MDYSYFITKKFFWKNNSDAGFWTCLYGFWIFFF